MGSDDDLILRLRERAADPAARGTSTGTMFDAQIGRLDLGQLTASLGDLGSMLSRLVEGQGGGLPVDEATAQRAEAIRAAMSSPASPADLPDPATHDELAAAQSRIGAPLPPLLRRVLSEVADGGWGPAGGLLSCSAMADRYAELGAEPP